jgi:hypothetical protein
MIGIWAGTVLGMLMVWDGLFPRRRAAKVEVSFDFRELERYLVYKGSISVDGISDNRMKELLGAEVFLSHLNTQISIS